MVAVWLAAVVGGSFWSAPAAPGLDFARIPEVPFAPRLDPILVPDGQTSPTRVEFWIERREGEGWVALAPTRRSIDAPPVESLADGRLALSETGGIPIWLINLEPVGDHRLAGGVETTAGWRELEPIGLEPRTVAPPADDSSPGRWILRVRGATEGPTAVALDSGGGPHRLESTMRERGAIADVYMAGTRDLLRAVAPDAPAAREEAFVWLKSLEWKFAVSPYSTGWLPVEDAHTRCRWTDGGGLHVEARPEADGETAGWRVVNLFRQPDTDTERRGPGSLAPGKAYDLSSRLLRVEARIDADVPAGARVTIRLGLEGPLSRHRAEWDIDGAVVYKDRLLSLYLAPPHHRAASRADLRLDAAFEVEVHATGGRDVRLALRNLQVWETPIAGVGAATGGPRDPWPAVRMMRIPEDAPTRLIRPASPQCDGDPPAGLQYFYADHAFFRDETGTWNLLGIFNMPGGFAPVLEGSPHPNAPFFAGLIHARSCIDGGPATSPFRGTSIRPGTEPHTAFHVDDDQPTYFFGPWAPTVERAGDEYVMIYTEHDTGDPGRGDGFRLLTSTRPSDPDRWRAADLGEDEEVVYTRSPRDTDRDLDLEPEPRPDGTTTWHAVWTGYRDEKDDLGAGKVLHKEAPGTPLALAGVPIGEERVVYDLHNPDSGRIDSECESPTLVHDKATGLFYLKVTKNGTDWPGQAYDNDVVLLDRESRSVLLVEGTRGDRSVLAGPGDGNPALGFHNPVGFRSLARETYRTDAAVGAGRLGTAARFLVLDAGSGLVPPALLWVDLISGRRLAFGIGRDSPLASAADLADGGWAWDKDRPGRLFVVSDPAAGRVYTVTGQPAVPEDAEVGGSLIIPGLVGPIAVSTEGMAAGSALVSANGRPVLRVEAMRAGVRPSEFGGALHLRLLHPMKPDGEARVVFHNNIWPDTVWTVVLATDGSGEVTSTAGEVARLLNEAGGGALRARVVPGTGGIVVEPARVTLEGGRNRRRLYAIVGPAGGEGPVVVEASLTDLRGGTPALRRVVAHEEPWEPADLEVVAGRLCIVDGRDGRVYTVERDDFPTILSLDDAAGLTQPVLAITAGTRDALFLGDDWIGVLDPSAGSFRPLVQPGSGGGPRHRSPGGGYLLNWSPQQVDFGARVYWSQRDPETGRLQPFTEDRYIGYLRHYAAELTPDPNQPGEPWYVTFPNSKDEGGYGLRPLEWIPPMGPADP